ncbi:hypothetical protein AYI68_g7672, partial [Smittium mucronatum]
GSKNEKKAYLGQVSEKKGYDQIKKITLKDSNGLGEEKGSIGNQIENEVIKKPKAILRRKRGIRVAENIPRYSIKGNLADLNSNVSFSQLLQASPEIFADLSKLLKKVEFKKEVGLMENNDTTNCKAIINLYKQPHLAIIDTGAACSVFTTGWINQAGLQSDIESTQTIITSDGKRHKTLGIISQAPIVIAGYTFKVDLLVMKNQKKSPTLGMDWLKGHEAVIDVRNQELVLPLDEYDVVLSLSTSVKKDQQKNLENEFLGI